MNALDVAFLGILGASLLYSIWKGFVRDVFSLVGLLGGFLLAARFYPWPAEWVKDWVSTPWAASLLGCVLIFLISFVAISMLGHMLWRGLRVLRLGWFDRMVGVGFGLLKGILLCAGVWVALASFLPPTTALLMESQFAPLVMEVTREIGRLIPKEWGERIPDRLSLKGWEPKSDRKPSGDAESRQP